MDILVTGGTGFVGSALAKTLRHHGHHVRCAVRNLLDHGNDDDTLTVIPVGNIDSMTDWRQTLDGQSIVVHTAGRAHVMRDSSPDPMSLFRQVNTRGSINLARQAADAGVKRFIFLSSIKVNGDQTKRDHPFTENSPPNPCDPYGISKLEAEEGIRRIGEESGMEYVIIRPTMVYGPGVKGNFRTMMHWLYRGTPLPLGAIYNLRSMVALGNLISLIVACIEKPAAANHVLLAGDGDDVSTPELLRRTGQALGGSARLFPCPQSLLEFGGAVIGKRSMMQRLCGTLQVNIGKARSLLQWDPPVQMEEELQKTADRYLKDILKGTYDTGI